MNGRDTPANECEVIINIRPTGWVWMFYHEKSRLARQFGIGPFLFYKTNKTFDARLACFYLEAIASKTGHSGY